MGCGACGHKYPPMPPQPSRARPPVRIPARPAPQIVPVAVVGEEAVQNVKPQGLPGAINITPVVPIKRG